MRLAPQKAIGEGMCKSNGFLSERMSQARVLVAWRVSLALAGTAAPIAGLISTSYTHEIR